MVDAKQILKLSDRAFSSTERSNQTTAWDIQAEFILPSSATGFLGDNTPGQKKMCRVFDPMPIQANQDLAAAIHSVLTNPATKWSSLRFKNEDLNNNDEATAWLEAVNNIIHTSFDESNFDTQVSKNYQSLTGLGTMILLQEEINEAGIFDRFRFEAVHLGEVAFSENYEGQVDCIYRKYKLTARQLNERWEDKIPDTVKRESEYDPEKTFDVVMCVCPRDKKDVKYIGKSGKANELNRPYAVYYILRQGEVFLEETGVYEFPFFVTRWQTMPGEVYGRGPGHIAIGGVRSLNKIQEFGLRRLAQVTKPTILVEENNMLTSSSLRPNEINVVRSIDRIKQFVPEGNPNEIQMGIEQLEQKIQSVFFIDKLFLPPRTETGEMSAYEVDQRLAQMQRVLGPTVSRLNSEFLTPLIIRSYEVLLRGGALPPQPDILVQKGFNVEIGFVNQLSRAQKVEDIANIQAWLHDVAMVAQIKPEVTDLVQGDDIVKSTAKLRSISETFVTNQEQLTAIRQKREQQQQAQQALNAGVQVADIQSKQPKQE